MESVVMGLIGLAVTLLGALVVSVWRFSALATTLAATVARLREDLAEVRKALEQLRDLPVFQQRLTQLENAVAKLASLWPRHGARLDVLEQRMGSTADKLRGVRMPSRPDPEE